MYKLTHYIFIQLFFITYALNRLEANDANGKDSCYEICSPMIFEDECCQGGAFLSADLLYLRAYEGGLNCDCGPFVIKDNFDSQGRVDTNFKKKNRHIHYQWDPGFRIGAGYLFGTCDNWDLDIFWTCYNSTTRKHHEFHGCNNLKWKINFNIVDGIIGRQFPFGPCFTLRAFIGLRGGWIEQKVRRNFKSFTFSPMGNETSTTFRKDREKFFGLGPLVGIDGNYHLGCGFSLYLSVDAACLFGYFHNKFRHREILENSNTFLHGRENLDAVTAAADAYFGIRWQKYFTESIQILFQLGLEHHQYFNFNQIGDYGDLSLDGGTFSVGLQF